MRLKWFVFTLAVLIAFDKQGQPAHAQKLVYPETSKLVPSDTLAAIKVEDVKRQLNASEKRELARLFVRAYVLSKRRYRQDFLLNPWTPVYELLKTHFPDVGEREGEGGIFLGEIVRYLNKSGGYSGVVEEELRRGPFTRGQCR